MYGDEVAEVARWAEGIKGIHQCIAGRFRRPGAASGSRSAGEVTFQTKAQLAQRMLERAVESGVPFGWVAAVAGASGSAPCAGYQEE